MRGQDSRSQPLSILVLGQEESFVTIFAHPPLTPGLMDKKKPHKVAWVLTSPGYILEFIMAVLTRVQSLLNRRHLQTSGAEAQEVR